MVRYLRDVSGQLHWGSYFSNCPQLSPPAIKISGWEASPLLGRLAVAAVHRFIVIIKIIVESNKMAAPTSLSPVTPELAAAIAEATKALLPTHLLPPVAGEAFDDKKQAFPRINDWAFTQGFAVATESGPTNRARFECTHHHKKTSSPWRNPSERGNSDSEGSDGELRRAKGRPVEKGGYLRASSSTASIFHLQRSQQY
jgi:hypothetical protein